MGNAVITATLNGVEAKGSARVSVTGDFDTAPQPTVDPDNVISIFSDAYTNEPVDFFNGFWAPFQTTLGANDITIGNDNLIAYTELNFVGIQFAVNVPTIDVSAMTHFHVDIQPREDLTAGDFLRIEILDLGPDNQFDTGDESTGQFTIDNTMLTNEEWFSLDIPISDIVGLSNRSNLAQIIFVTDATISSVYICLLYTSPSPRDATLSRMPSSA